jgi:hypothetical protein
MARKKTSILAEAEKLTNHDRKTSYGHPLDDYTRTAALFNAAFAHKISEKFQPEDIMLAMVLVKISREINSPKRDNRVDGAGYFNCIDMSYEERAKRKTK